MPATKVYKYALKDPINYDSSYDEELIRMNRFWNKLVEIDRTREQRYKKLCADMLPEYKSAFDAAEAMRPEVDALFDEIREERVKTRSREISPEFKEKKDSILNKRRKYFDIMKTEAKKIPKEAMVGLNEQFKAEVKLARQTSELFWGNYNAVIQSFETARSKAMKDGGGAKVHFQKYDGSGRFVNQIQGGLSVEGLFNNGSTQISASNLIQKNAKKSLLDFTFTAFRCNNLPLSDPV